MNNVKGEIASNLVLLAPPCEILNVVHDVRTLTGDDTSAIKKTDEAIKQYTKDQFTQIQLPNSDHRSILCIHSDLGGGKYRCPRSSLLYTFDFSHMEPSEIGKMSPDNAIGGSISIESWRHALEESLTSYLAEHYPGGAVSVFAPIQDGKPILIACIESHYSKNTTTGRWRSEWTIHLGEHPEETTVEVTGWIRVQTHLYEEGNIQLISSKEIKFDLAASNPTKFAEECAKSIHYQDDIYQVAISQNFQAMSETTLKALRRQLPVTKTKIDWTNINSYQIGHEISKPVSN